METSVQNSSFSSQQLDKFSYRHPGWKTVWVHYYVWTYSAVIKRHIFLLNNESFKILQVLNKIINIRLVHSCNLQIDNQFTCNTFLPVSATEFISKFRPSSLSQQKFKNISIFIIGRNHHFFNKRWNGAFVGYGDFLVLSSLSISCNGVLCNCRH